MKKSLKVYKFILIIFIFMMHYSQIIANTVFSSKKVWSVGRHTAAIIFTFVIVVHFVPMPSDGSLNTPLSFPATWRKKSQAFCTAWDNDYYKTFDGKLFTYPSQCTYILAKDCVHQTFSIYKTNGRCSSNERCSMSIDIYIGMDKTLTLERDQQDFKVRLHYTLRLQWKCFSYNKKS